MRRLHRLQSGLLVLIMLPVVAEDGQGVRNTLRWVLHLQLDRVLVVVHILVVFVLLNGKDALLSVGLFGINREDHVVGNECLLWLLASLI